jgi:hypothetical protein
MLISTLDIIANLVGVFVCQKIGHEFLSTHACMESWEYSDAIRVADLPSFYWLLACLSHMHGHTSTRRGCDWMRNSWRRSIYDVELHLTLVYTVRILVDWNPLREMEWECIYGDYYGRSECNELEFPILSKGMWAHGSISIEKKRTKLTKT